MAAEIPGGAVRLQIPFVDIHANEIIDAAGLAFPGSVLPRSADGSDIFKPRNFRGDALELFAITEFPRAASALQAEEFVLAGHRAVSGLPVFVKSPNIADKRSDASDCGEKEVMGPAAL